MLPDRDAAVTPSRAPYDLSATETARWDQVDDLPRDAVAIFPPDAVPGTTPDYSKATIHYLNLYGQEVNRAALGGAISTTEHDANGQVIRELTAANRAAALAVGGSSAAEAERRSTRYVLHPTLGIVNVDVFEPETTIKLSNGTSVRGRRHTITEYDIGAPTAGGPYYLPTKVTEEVLISSSGVAVDARQNIYGYDNPDGSPRGWQARQAVKTVVDPPGTGPADLQLTSWEILHPTYPLVEESRTPEGAGGGTTPDVQFHQYYNVSTTASGRVPVGIRSTDCQSTTAARPSGFLCMTSEGTTGTAAAPRKWFDYHPLGSVSDTWQSKTLSRTGSPSKHTQATFDALGRRSTESTTGPGAALQTRTYGYDADSGREISVATSSSGTIGREFDLNGRLMEYVDASGAATVYAYDLRGRKTSATQGGATTTYGYDDRDNVTSVTHPAVGSPISASYDLDDRLITEALPIGLEMATSYDEAGNAAELSWEKTTHCSGTCEWILDRITSRDAQGRITGRETTATETAYAYDDAGRITRVDATRLSDLSCVRREYGYDTESNRTQRSTSASGTGQPCGAASSTTENWSHDDADRMTSSGWSHDDFGRVTGVPSGDSGASSALAATYFANDRVRSLTLGGRTHTYDRDPLDRRTVVASTGGAAASETSTYRYEDDTDTPVAVVYGIAGATAKLLRGPSGRLVAVNEAGTTTYRLQNLQGDVVATVAGSPTAPAPSGQVEYDEFGGVASATPAVIDSARGVSGYGWLGALHRTTEFGHATGSAGAMEMGARVYLPAAGRFLQVDPVSGGSANAYDYANQDSVNNVDLDGLSARRAAVMAQKAGVTPKRVGLPTFPPYATCPAEKKARQKCIDRQKARNKGSTDTTVKVTCIVAGVAGSFVASPWVGVGITAACGAATW